MAFHVITFALSVTLPEILDRKPILDEIITVNLVSLPGVQEPVPQQKTPSQAAIKKPAEAKRAVPVKAEVQIAKVTEPLPEKSQPVKPVSLKPLKRKVRKTDPKKIAREKVRKQRAKERQRDLARAVRAEAEAKEEARLAREALASLLVQKGIQKSASASRKSSGRKGSSNLSGPFMNYVAALQGQVQQYWVLPDMKQWDPRLETIVVLYIRRNGTVAKTIIEKKSKDPFFDQFVMSTIDKAQPLPRIPSLIKEVPLEVGFRFRPGGLVSM